MNLSKKSNLCMYLKQREASSKPQTSLTPVTPIKSPRLLHTRQELFRKNTENASKKQIRNLLKSSIEYFSKPSTPCASPLPHIHLPKSPPSTKTIQNTRDVSYIFDQGKLHHHTPSTESQKLLSVISKLTSPSQNYPQSISGLREYTESFSEILQQKPTGKTVKSKQPLFKTDIFKDIPPEFYQLSRMELLQAESSEPILEFNQEINYTGDSELGIPAGRADAIALLNWFQNIVKKLNSENSIDSEEKFRLTQGVYYIAYKEAVRQVTVHCVERGRVLWKIWKSYLALITQMGKYWVDRIEVDKAKYTEELKENNEKHMKEIDGYAKLIPLLKDENNKMKSETEILRKELHETRQKHKTEKDSWASIAEGQMNAVEEMGRLHNKNAKLNDEIVLLNDIICGLKKEYAEYLLKKQIVKVEVEAQAGYEMKSKEVQCEMAKRFNAATQTDTQVVVNENKALPPKKPEESKKIIPEFYRSVTLPPPRFKFSLNLCHAFSVSIAPKVSKIATFGEPLNEIPVILKEESKPKETVTKDKVILENPHTVILKPTTNPAPSQFSTKLPPTESNVKISSRPKAFNNNTAYKSIPPAKKPPESIIKGTRTNTSSKGTSINHVENKLPENITAKSVVIDSEPETENEDTKVNTPIEYKTFVQKDNVKATSYKPAEHNQTISLKKLVTTTKPLPFTPSIAQKEKKLLPVTPAKSFTPALAKHNFEFAEFTLGRKAHVNKKRDTKFIVELKEAIRTQRKKVAPLPKKAVLKLIAHFYKGLAESIKQAPPQEFSVYVYTELANKYGLKAVADKKFEQLLSGCLAYNNDCLRIKVFGRFMGMCDPSMTYANVKRYLDCIQKLKEVGGEGDEKLFTQYSKAVEYAKICFENKRFWEEFLSNVLGFFVYNDYE